MKRKLLKIYFLIGFVILVTSGVIIIDNLKFSNETYTLHDKSKKYDVNFSDESPYVKTPEKMVLDIFLPMRITGIVIGKYKKRMEHNTPILWIEDQNSYYDIQLITFGEGYEDFYNEIEIGDSIFKNKGSLIFSVKRGVLIKNFKVSPFEQYWGNPYYQANSSIL